MSPAKRTTWLIAIRCSKSCGGSLASLPGRPVGKGVRFETVAPHRDAVARGGGHEVATVAHDHGIDEVLVQVVHVFDDAVLERRADAHVIEDCEMLHVFAQPYPAGMGTDRDPELRSEQQYCQHLIDPAQAAAVDLAK